MSQQMRRILTALGLVVALLLAIPAPSRAASLRGPALTSGLMETVWSWIQQSLAPKSASRTAASSTTTSPTPVPATPTGKDQSGSHIDPDGKP